ncbi:IS5 family transposase [Desulfovibrio piger]|nr:IS5 family transposase [Escherichia coli]EHN3351124.1 IS5 family transposase [Escherichia coli]
MGKRSASTPNGRLWTAPCCKPRRALKKSATEGLGRNPTDRGRSGGKIHLHVDGQGIPLGVTVTGANVHDSRLIEATLKNSREMGGWFLGSAVRHLCLDKGYDYPRVSEEVYVNGFEEHIRSRGEEVRDRWRTPARRWVVERTFAWLKSFRSLRTRYCCYLVNFMGLLYLALACILWRKLV